MKRSLIKKGEERMKYYLIFFIMMYATSVFAQEGGASWRSKPVQCGPSDSGLQIIQRQEQEALIGGFTIVQLENDSLNIPFYLFVNTDTGTFTIVEYHPNADEFCILGYGSGIDFDVRKYFENKDGDL